MTKQLTRPLAYTLPVLFCGAAFSVAYVLDAPSSCFMLAVMATTLFAGRGPAFLAVALAAVLFEFHFLPPANHFLHPPAEFIRFGLFVGAQLIAIALIEARKRSELARIQLEQSLRSTQARLAQATQLATASELAAAIVHEISQPLSSMVANGHTALRWLAATPPNLIDGRAAVDRIVRDGRDAAEIIKGLRSLFRHAPLERIELDLTEIVAEVLFLLRTKAEQAGITIEAELPDRLPHILGDKIQLQQVLMNLISNGIESMQQPESVISPSAQRLTIRMIQQQTHVLTSIEDHGPGIQYSGVDAFDALFEPFFTTKEKGMGMGLAICRSIVEAHNGKLWGEPAPTGGSVFSFTVPLLEGSPS